MKELIKLIEEKSHPRTIELKAIELRQYRMLTLNEFNIIKAFLGKKYNLEARLKVIRELEK